MPERKPVDGKSVDQFPFQDHLCNLARNTGMLQDHLLIEDIVVDRDAVIRYTVQKQAPGSVTVCIEIGMACPGIQNLIVSPVQEIIIRAIHLVEFLF